MVGVSLCHFCRTSFVYLRRNLTKDRFRILKKKMAANNTINCNNGQQQIPPSDTTNNSRTIETFAILDLETSGLDTNSARITEIAILAVSRQDFLSSVRNNCVFPRILSKILLPVNPGVFIHPKAAEVSGLNNEILTPHEYFPSAFAVIAPFLSRLPTPICLVAHNGRRFDFPLLKAELARYDLNLQGEVLCVDSFVLIPKIDKQWFTERLQLQKQQLPTPEAKTVEKQIEEVIEINVKNVEEIEQEPITPIYSYTMNYGDRIESWRTPVKQQSPITNSTNLNYSNSNVNSTVTQHEETSGPSELLLTAVRETSTNDSSYSMTGIEPLAKQIITQMNKFPSNYGQVKIYERLFNRAPKNSHTAEGDCEALLEIMLCYGEEFVKNAEKCAVLV